MFSKPGIYKNIFIYNGFLKMTIKGKQIYFIGRNGRREKGGSRL